MSVIKEQKLDKLCFECWRQGLKHRDILDKAKTIDERINSAEVKKAFKNMFKRELSEHAQYL